MTIPEQMQTITAELISRNGIGYKVSAGEIKAMVKARFGTNLDSIIPPDYCYNRVNKGIVFMRYPRLFAHIGRGVYECIGENYPYNGVVYAQPRGLKNEIIVGAWENGVFIPNVNWESYCMK